MGILNLITLILAIVTIPYVYRYMVLAIQSLLQNHLTSEQKRAFAVVFTLFTLLGIVTISNLAIRVLSLLGSPVSHELSAVRSVITQLATLMTAVFYAKIGTGIKE